MGKVSDYIIELGETFEDLLWHTGDYESAKRNMQEQLSEDEWEFFIAHEDVILQNLEYDPENHTAGMHEDIETTGSDQESWLDDFENILRQKFNMSIEEIDKLTTQFQKSIDQYFEANEYPNVAAEAIVKASGINEAAGLKGDLLRPYGGRKSRANMGYGKGNRANFEIDPEDELGASDMEPSPEDLNGDVTVGQGERHPHKRIDWPKEMTDDTHSGNLDDENDDLYMEEIPGESEDDWIYGEENHDERMASRKEMLAKPAPVGTGGVDNVFDDDGKRKVFNKNYTTSESLEMPSIGEFKENAVVERYEEGHPQSRYDSDGDRKDPQAPSGHTISGKSVTWEELWQWYETEGEYERD